MAIRMDVGGEKFHGSIKLNGEVNAPKNRDWNGRTLYFRNTKVLLNELPRENLETMLEDWFKVKFADRLRKMSYESAKVKVSDAKGIDWKFAHARMVQTRSPAEVMGDARKAWKDATPGADKNAKEAYFRKLVRDMAEGLGVEPSAIAPDLKW